MAKSSDIGEFREWCKEEGGEYRKGQRYRYCNFWAEDEVPEGGGAVARTGLALDTKKDSMFVSNDDDRISMTAAGEMRDEIPLEDHDSIEVGKDGAINVHRIFRITDNQGLTDNSVLMTTIPDEVDSGEDLKGVESVNDVRETYLRMKVDE